MRSAFSLGGLSTPNSARRKEHRNQGRRRILEAAQELFDTCGIDGMSMRAVAKRAGLTASALYAHFPTKIDLLRELRWEILDRLQERLAAISPGKPDPIAAIRAIAQAYTAFALENPIPFHILFLMDSGKLAYELKHESVRYAPFAIVRRTVAEAIEQGRLRLNDSDLAAQMIWAGVHGVLTLTDSAGMFPFMPPSIPAASMIDVLVAGLCLEPETSGEGRHTSQ